MIQKSLRKKKWWLFTNTIRFSQKSSKKDEFLVVLKIYFKNNYICYEQVHFTTHLGLQMFNLTDNISGNSCQTYQDILQSIKK